MHAWVGTWLWTGARHWRLGQRRCGKEAFTSALLRNATESLAAGRTRWCIGVQFFVQQLLPGAYAQMHQALAAGSDLLARQVAGVRQLPADVLLMANTHSRTGAGGCAGRVAG